MDCKFNVFLLKRIKSVKYVVIFWKGGSIKQSWIRITINNIESYLTIQANLALLSETEQRSKLLTKHRANWNQYKHQKRAIWSLPEPALD